MKLQQAYKAKVADAWHIVWRSLHADGSGLQDLSSNGVSFVYYGPLEPRAAKALLNSYLKSRSIESHEPGVYWIN